MRALAAPSIEQPHPSSGLLTFSRWLTHALQSHAPSSRQQLFHRFVFAVLPRLQRSQAVEPFGPRSRSPSSRISSNNSSLFEPGVDREASCGAGSRIPATDPAITSFHCVRRKPLRRLGRPVPFAAVESKRSGHLGSPTKTLVGRRGNSGTQTVPISGACSNEFRRTSPANRCTR